LNLISDKYNIEKYDFITTFKFISEFYNSDYQTARTKKLYKKFIEFNEYNLKENGILIMLDLVSGNFNRIEGELFRTQIMSNEVKNYIRSNNRYMTILIPASCAHWARMCNCEDCYIQRTIKIEHSHTTYAYDLSNVSYFVLAKTNFANTILNSLVIQNSYKISHNRWYPGYCENGNRLEGNIINLSDGFKIS